MSISLLHRAVMGVFSNQCHACNCVEKEDFDHVTSLPCPSQVGLPFKHRMYVEFIHFGHVKLMQLFGMSCLDKYGYKYVRQILEHTKLMT